MTATVTALATTPVKGTRIHEVDRVELRPGGAVGDRRFYLVDERGHMVNGKRLGGLSEVIAELPDPATLRLTFPDGHSVQGPIRDGETVTTSFYSRPRADPVLSGPFAEALSRHLGRLVQLVRATDPGRGVDRGAEGGVSLISRASIEALAAHAGVPEIDGRRFRMLVEVDGVAANAEDTWVGSRVRVGSALVAVHGHVARCLITSRDPETGTVDLPTLDLLREYRPEVDGTPLPLGVYGEVVEPGHVALGDAVTIDT